MTSHAELFRAAYAVTGAAVSVQKRPLHVQVRFKGATLCAEVVRLFDVDGVEWVKMKNDFLGDFSRPARVVRACEGDGSGHVCACSPVDFSAGCHGAGFSRAGVVAPHESPTGGNFGVGAADGV